MSLLIHVDAYSGFKANERPSQFVLDEEIYEIAAVLDQWYEPSATYFKVQSTEGKTYLLRYYEETDEWTLQSGFDGDEPLARTSIELVTVDADVIRRAEKQIESCEQCHPNDAEIPFDWILAEVTGQRGAVDFVFERTGALFELPAADYREDARGTQGELAICFILPCCPSDRVNATS